MSFQFQGLTISVPRSRSPVTAASPNPEPLLSEPGIGSTPSEAILTSCPSAPKPQDKASQSLKAPDHLSLPPTLFQDLSLVVLAIVDEVRSLLSWL